MSALEKQEGGSHYKDCAIQPIQYIEANKIAFLEGCVIKRCTRHDKPTGKGRQDIEKAIHELQLLLELRYPELDNEDGWIKVTGDSEPKTSFMYYQIKLRTGEIVAINPRDPEVKINWSRDNGDMTILAIRQCSKEAYLEGLERVGYSEFAFHG